MGKVLHLRGLGKKMETQTSIFDVAEWFLQREPMDHKKLQKLCYYAYAWYLALYGKRLFPNRFESWIHGPVEPTLYQKYKCYGWQDISSSRERLSLPNTVQQLLEAVYDSYGDLSGNQLERLAHMEAPWKCAREGLEDWEACNQVLDDEIIAQYYQRVRERNQDD